VDEGGVDDDVVLIVPGFLVEGATTGDEPESGVVDGAIDGFGGEEVFGVAVDGSTRKCATLRSARVTSMVYPGCMSPRLKKTPGPL